MKINKSGWHMKENYLILMLSIIFLFVLGCASVNPKVHKMEKGFIDSISKHKDMKVGLIEFKTSHIGSTGRAALFGIAGMISKTPEEIEYSHNLKMKYYKVIEEEINGNTPFQLKTKQLKDIPKLRDFAFVEEEREKWEISEENRKLIKQFIESNGLNGALSIHCSHGISGYIVYKVTLYTTWIIYDQDGREAINITTYYKSKDSVPFANTLSPRYEATFLKFFKMSANDFISVFTKNN